MTNSADPDQLASSEYSGIFIYITHIYTLHQNLHLLFTYPNIWTSPHHLLHVLNSPNILTEWQTMQILISWLQNIVVYLYTLHIYIHYIKRQALHLLFTYPNIWTSPHHLLHVLNSPNILTEWQTVQILIKLLLKQPWSCWSWICPTHTPLANSVDPDQLKWTDLDLQFVCESVCKFGSTIWIK